MRSVTVIIFAVTVSLHSLLSEVAYPTTGGSLVNAILTPQSFSTQQPARLTITIESKQAAEVIMPEVDGLIFHQRGRSSQFQMINGKTSHSTHYTYLVQATKPGTYSIPPITIKTKEGVHHTKEIFCTVAGSPAALPQHRQAPSAAIDPEPEAQLDNIAFIKLLPGKEKAYLGEVIPTTIKAYFNRAVRFKFNALPELIGDGFLLETLTNEPRQQEEVINDTPHMVLTWNTSLTGIKEGTSDLKVEMDVSMLVRTPGQRPSLPGFGGRFQDDFFDDFFARYENQPIRIVSPFIPMEVNALPETGKPDNYTGAIGSFTMDIEAQPTEISPGDPITLTLSITGNGNFDTVSLPVLTETAGIKTYSPTVSFTEGTNQAKSIKKFEQAVILTDPARQQIPPFMFSYFDPVNETYETILTDPITVAVSGDHTPSTTPNPSSRSQNIITADNDEQLPYPELAPVKLEAGRGVHKLKPLFLKPPFLTVLLLLGMGIVTLTGYRVRSQFLLKHPEIVREKLLARKRNDCLICLQNLQSEDDSAYLKGAHSCLADFLSLLWVCKGDSLTASDIRRRLGAEHPVTDLFKFRDHTAYGASSFSLENRKELHEKLLKLIPTLS